MILWNLPIELQVDLTVRIGDHVNSKQEERFFRPTCYSARLCEVTWRQSLPNVRLFITQLGAHNKYTGKGRTAKNAGVLKWLEGHQLSTEDFLLKVRLKTVIESEGVRGGSICRHRPNAITCDKFPVRHFPMIMFCSKIVRKCICNVSTPPPNIHLQHLWW